MYAEVESLAVAGCQPGTPFPGLPATATGQGGAGWGEGSWAFGRLALPTGQTPIPTPGGGDNCVLDLYYIGSFSNLINYHRYQMNPPSMCLISEAETSIDHGILQGLSCLQIPLGFNEWKTLKGDPTVGRRVLESSLTPFHHPTPA